MSDPSPNTTLLALTPKQVKAIYDAGRKRGEDCATAYEWGSRPDGEEFDELEDAMLWNGDFKGVVPDGHDEKKAWWAAYVSELAR
jgi:hypothetical protein